MRSPRHLLAPFLPVLTVAVAIAQEPPPPPATEQPAATESAPPQAGEGERPRRGARDGQGPGRRGPRRTPIAIEAGHVHPVSGPVIEDGVILIRGDRIVAIGKKGEVELPENTVTRSFPNGHVYPGLVDAATDAFVDPAMAQVNLDPGLAVSDDLQLRHTRDDALVAAGITTAYVAGNGGQGAVVRPRQDGFEVWEGKDHAALELRMTSGPAPSHPLQRQQQLDGLLRTFDDLEQYEKAKEEFNKALDKYEKDFAEYLEFHRKKKAEGKPAEATDKPSPPQPGNTPEGGAEGERQTRRGGRRGGPPGGGQAAGTDEVEVDHALELLLEALAAETAAPQDPPPAPPQGQEPPQGQNPRGGRPGGPQPQGGEQKPEEPKRPTYPRKPPEDPAKEVLLKVRAGELPLRVEAHRPDELRAALTFLTDKNVPLLVLEKAYAADAVAAELAKNGAFVVLTDVLPNSMPKPYEDFDPQSLPAKLDRHGVPFAIASGSARRAPLLPLMAAAAVGKGLSADAALRAITLTAAEILGVQQDVGSLQVGKLADLVVFDRPLFQSDSRVLFVVGKGRTEYEVK